MYGKVMIDGIEVAMRGSAATPYRYKQVFHEDMLKVTQSIGAEGPETIDFAMKVGYVMAMQASDADMQKLSEGTFVEWCDQYSFDGMLEAVEGILTIYAGNSQTDSDAKKNPVQQSES